MKIQQKYCWLIMTVCVSASGLQPAGSWASDAFGSGWDIGWETSAITYEEPNVMKQEGVMNGISASFTNHQETLVRVDARYSGGNVDYVSNGTGAMDDIDDFAWEMRFLLGQDLYRSADGFITPYFGFGYRYLNDNSQGRLTTTGYLGYERESNYYYTPLGIWGTKRMRESWLVSAMLEYDFFWRGVQESNLSGAISGLEDVENEQNDGYGCRASVRLMKDNTSHVLFVEPFVRYWNIDRSENANITYSGVIVGYGYEPENTSLEYGLKIGAYF